MDILFLAIGLLVGAAAVYFVFRNRKAEVDTGELDNLRAQNLQLQTNGSRLEEGNKQLSEQLQETKAELRQSQEKVTDLSGQLSARQSDLRNLNERLEEQKKEIAEMQLKLTTEFKNIANEILEDKSKKFTEQNKTNLDGILKPLNDKIKDFEQKVEASHKASLMQNAGLKEQLTMLQNLNQKMSEEARNLTRALKGESKTQGNWGELILERILEKSGLVKDREYTVQPSFTTEDGKRYQPDIVINLPENKTVVVDSKVSLVDYERYCATEDDAERDNYLKSHIRSIRAHMKGLSEKEYHNLYELNGLDFVLLFVPVEPAFNLAIQHDNSLYDEALEKNIVIVSTSTLLATLRTIASIWRQEYQNKNAMEIARQSGALYDKFVGLSQDLIDIGRKIDTSKDAYKSAMNKLVEGRGNLISRVEKLRELGAKASKTIAQPMLDKAGVEAGSEISLPEED